MDLAVIGRLRGLDKILDKIVFCTVLGANCGNNLLDSTKSQADYEPCGGGKVTSVKRMCFVIYAYGDDGADAKKERVTAVSVIAGYEDWWQDLESKWVARCGGIPFHANECESDLGDYKNIPHEQNKALYRDLTTLLAESRVGGIAIAIDLIAQHKVFPGSLELSYYRAFLECLTRTAELGKNLGEVAELTFDISSENEYNAELLYKTMREGDPELLTWLHPRISFIPAKESARVQTGDLLAYEAWKALDHTVGQARRKRRSWEVLRDTGRFETYSYSEEWFEDLKRHIESGQLGKKVGFSEKDYIAWLAQRNRQHNMSTLIEFLDWIRRRDERQGRGKV
jgi:hypothetical protein